VDFRNIIQSAFFLTPDSSLAPQKEVVPA